MARRLVVLDTSIYCCWLRVPGKETAGSGDTAWDYERTAKTIQSEIEEADSLLVLPLATLIETGNHIAKAPTLRYERAMELAKHLVSASQADTPRAAFTQQASLWEPDGLMKLSDEWPSQAAAGLSFGDATIGSVAEYYSRSGYEVYVLTADRGLQLHVSTSILRVPRRRMRRR